jgi:hypothetical protein
MSLILLALLVISGIIYGGLAVYFELSFWIGIIAGIIFLVLILIYHKFYVE